MSVAPQANQAGATGLPAVPQAPPPTTRGDVESEVNAEIIAATAPLESEAAGFQAASDRAIQDLNTLFSNIMPFVAGSAQRVAESYGATNQAQASIFNQAWERLNSLRGEGAADAQALAQQLGAPLPIDAFTKGTTQEMGVFVPEAAGELLKATTIGQAGVQEAEAFAGRVWPLKEVRLETETRNYYRDKISDLRSQIAALKAQKPGLVNERFRQRQLEDYQNQLARYEALFNRWSTQQNLKLQQKQLDAQIAQAEAEARARNRSMTLEERRFAEEKRQYNQTLAEQKRANRAGEGLEQQRIDVSKQQSKVGNASYINQQKQNIVGVVNGLASPGPNLVDVKTGRWVDTDGDGKADKYVSATQTRNLAGDAVRNPTQLLNKTLAQLGIRPGQKVLYNFAVAQVIQTLKALGMTGIPNDPAKWGAWWKQRQKRLNPKPQTVGVGGAPPGKKKPPNAGPGYWIQDSKGKWKWIEYK